MHVITKFLFLMFHWETSQAIFGWGGECLPSRMHNERSYNNSHNKGGSSISCETRMNIPYAQLCPSSTMMWWMSVNAFALMCGVV